MIIDPNDLVVRELGMKSPDILPKRAPEAAIFLTHDVSERVLAHFRRLKRESALLLDCYLCIDAKRVGSRCSLLPEHILVRHRAAETTMSARFYQSRFWSPFNYHGHKDLLFVPLLARPPLSGYRFVWIVEFDVDYAGDWATFFRAASSSTADLLATTLQSRLSSRQWRHWDWFACSGDVPLEQQRRMFQPIIRLSRDLTFAFIEAAQDPRWRGHFEAVLPTVAMHRGLAIEDIAGLGSATSDGSEKQWYTNTPAATTLSPGTLVWRPGMPAYYHENPSGFSQPDMLYHPIKIQQQGRRSKITVKAGRVLARTFHRMRYGPLFRAPGGR